VAAGTLYVSDLDGTLLNSSGRISPRSLDVLSGLIDGSGIPFTVASARSFGTATRAVSRCRSDGLRAAATDVLGDNDADVVANWLAAHA
jgi:hypothetical protein